MTIYGLYKLYGNGIKVPNQERYDMTNAAWSVHADVCQLLAGFGQLG